MRSELGLRLGSGVIAAVVTAWPTVAICRGLGIGLGILGVSWFNAKPRGEVRNANDNPHKLLISSYIEHSDKFPKNFPGGRG